MFDFNQVLKLNLKYTDEFRGCLIGGAAGDALGYPVEFRCAEEIFKVYGHEGIREYELSHGKALISDDTQMTLFTATGLLLGKTRGMTHGIGGAHYSYPGFAYKTWYRMQRHEQPRNAQDFAYSWLADVPEMGENRAPGNTCMSVIGGDHYGTVDEPINHSKGCGGIMRVAPVGLYFNRPTLRCGTIKDVWEQATGVAALTHGHELGWLPAGVLAHIVNRLAYSGMTLIEAIREAQEYLNQTYKRRKHTKELSDLIDKTVSLTLNQEADLDNIRSLGEGWVAEETLAIAIYCSLKYEDDFSKALTVSVSHGGDSDSTGAVCGNILGTLWGYERIPSQWKEHLECLDVILEVADDLCHDCQIAEYGPFDREWERKYIENRRYERTFPNT